MTNNSLRFMQFENVFNLILLNLKDDHLSFELKFRLINYKNFLSILIDFYNAYLYLLVYWFVYDEFVQKNLKFEGIFSPLRILFFLHIFVFVNIIEVLIFYYLSYFNFGIHLILASIFLD